MKAKPKRELKRRQPSTVTVAAPSRSPARVPYVRIAVLLALLFGLMLLAKYASANGDDHNNHDYQTAVTNVYKGVNTVEVVAVIALLICPVRSIYTRIAEKRWTWCGEDREKEPPPNFGPAVKEEYNALPDLKVYQ